VVAIIAAFGHSVTERMMKLVTRSLICSTFIVGLLPVAPVRAEQNEPRGDAQITPASAVGLRVLNDEKRSGEGMVLSSARTVTDQPIRYPSGAATRVTAIEITLEPGQETGWHMHPVPIFGYILDGELTVDSGAKGQQTYRKSEGFVEPMNEAHNGRNSGKRPVTILAVIIGAEGVQ
jgi:quercetin dioxygenase-like cupin family protein